MVALTYRRSSSLSAAAAAGADGYLHRLGLVRSIPVAEYASPMIELLHALRLRLSELLQHVRRGVYRSFGYNYYGYGSPYYPYYPGGGWVDIGVTPPIVGPPVTPQPEGRAVNGHGYTQIRDRQPEPAPRDQQQRQRRGWGGNGSGASSGGYSSGSSSSGSSGGSSGVAIRGARRRAEGWRRQTIAGTSARRRVTFQGLRGHHSPQAFDLSRRFP